MGRRGHAGLADGLLELARALPWWGALAVATASYFALHALAGIEIPALAAPGALSGLVVRQLAATLASVLQYVVPALLCLGALIAALGRWRGERLHAQAETGGAATVAGMDWADFERLVAAVFRHRGMHVTRLGGNGPDGGVDLVATRGGERFLVQCKQWRAMKVSVSVVRELYGVIAAQGAAGGFVVTSGRFTRDAQAFARGRNIHLIDGERLQHLFAQVRPQARTEERAQVPDAAASQPSAPETPAYPAPPPRSVYSAIVAPPQCPRCGALMVKRFARAGSHAGEPFWGCARFPKCRGILPVSDAPRASRATPLEH